MEWASNNKFRFLSSFTNWIKSTIFYPVRRVFDVSAIVELELELGELSMASDSECPKCRELFKFSDILDMVEAIDWKEINTLNLKRIVSFTENI